MTTLEVRVAGQWVEDARYPSGWRWDHTAPAADPNPTNIMSAYAGGSPMTEHSTRRDVYDPRLGTDGGGRYADPSPIPAIDPDNPVTHVDQLGPGDGPGTWTGSDPDSSFADGRIGAATPSSDLVACPTCGTGVHPDRLRD